MVKEPNKTAVTVQRIRLAHFIKTVLKDVEIPLVKMDIEGEEFAVLTDLASEGLLCKNHIHTILVEYHRNPRSWMKDTLKRMISRHNCAATDIIEFDDETYLHDV